MVGRCSYSFYFPRLESYRRVPSGNTLAVLVLSYISTFMLSLLWAGRI